MPRPATGTVEPYEHADGETVSFYVRFRALGRRWRLDLGTNHEGWSYERARVELDGILERVRRGTWQPPDQTPAVRAAREDEESVHVTASRWWQRRRDELSEDTQADYRWRLDHILRHLAHEPTAEMDVQKVDDFRDELRAVGLSPRSVYQNRAPPFLIRAVTSAELAHSCQLRIIAAMTTGAKSGVTEPSRHQTRADVERQRWHDARRPFTFDHLHVRVASVLDARAAAEAGEIGADLATRQALVDLASFAEEMAARLPGPTRPMSHEEEQASKAAGRRKARADARTAL